MEKVNLFQFVSPSSKPKKTTRFLPSRVVVDGTTAETKRDQRGVRGGAAAFGSKDGGSSSRVDRHEREREDDEKEEENDCRVR